MTQLRTQLDALQEYKCAQRFLGKPQLHTSQTLLCCCWSGAVYLELTPFGLHTIPSPFHSINLVYTFAF
jgi:hypothetical protein